MNDSQKVWEALRAIYGMDLTAATLVVLTKDGETVVKFQTIYFPQQEKNTTSCGHEETIVKGSLVHCKKCDYCFGVD